MAARVFASPNARRLAREAGLRIDDLTGTGPGGRIIGRDVRAALRAPVPTSVPAVPVTAPARTGGPQISVRATVRVRRLLKLRDRLNDDGEPERISLDDLLVRAAARAHRLTRAMNPSAEPDVNMDMDVAVAIPTARGLVTPVLKGADGMPLSALAAALRDLSARADELRADETGGGSLTVIDLGSYGTEEVDAAVSPSRPAVLAVGAVHEEPVVRKGRVKPAQVMKVTLSVDPRVIEVTAAADWMRTFVGLLRDPVRVLL
ncbi:hypothetical protein Acsp03_30700 [Actinomadura sp. NBRC 104412]|uniref:2-oxo acid dehydrogenase subunit E2 n=1 Tax=Actinomadura sp. NBRC 104412 TaxID=3032203 RepID=UPI0024A1FF0B|nr:2-oxo acid dehydrogenase subunit E2 [Actinomadura sp. NBRC 104412]GLZ05604.1 hypothetical protein Acsp03_30700 [Actinomadura sp. NBRC 104412]